MVKITLQIDGMMCGMCESHVNDAIRRTLRVRKVTSSHAKNTTEILADGDIPDAELRRVLEGTGYRLLSVTRAPYEKKGFWAGLFGK